MHQNRLTSNDEYKSLVERDDWKLFKIIVNTSGGISTVIIKRKKSYVRLNISYKGHVPILLLCNVYISHMMYYILHCIALHYINCLHLEIKVLQINATRGCSKIAM